MNESKTDKSELLVKLFEEGRQFTEDLLRENERLRRGLASQKAEVGTEEKDYNTLANTEARERIRRLEAEKNHYRGELKKLQETLSEVEEENQEFANKYVEVEQQNSNLANLYVASYRLHSTLDFNEVIAIIKEIVINLVGSEVFGIFLKDENSNDLILATEEGLEGRHVPPITIGIGEIGEAAEKGELYMRDSVGGDGKPIACIPLKLQDKLLGMIVIYSLLRQKDGLAQLDFELFSLMADHAATAIYSSQLHTMAERKLSTMQGLLDLLKQ
ncbi:MAG TPA: GAF domain-containing protein [Nitrospiria bacterium]|nr:GAF domain-containing protein [Nitrospiria bacterium]